MLAVILCHRGLYAADDFAELYDIAYHLILVLEFGIYPAYKPFLMCTEMEQK